MRLDEFVESDHRLEYLVEGVLVKGQPGVIAGPSKGMKTGIGCCDLAVSLATGTKFLGRFQVPHAVNVAVMTGESGLPTIQETMIRVLGSKGINSKDKPDIPLYVTSQLPIITDLNAVLMLKKWCKENATEVLILDPFYLMLDGIVDERSLFKMGPILGNLSTQLGDIGVTLIILHHANRQLHIGEWMELRHLSYTGLEQFSRQFILINRRTAYKADGEHNLIVTIGGSAGFGGRYGIHISEGLTDTNFNGRLWDVKVIEENEMKQQSTIALAQKAEQKSRDRIKSDTLLVLAAIDKCDKIKKVATKNAIRQETGLQNPRVEKALELLHQEDSVETYSAQVKSGKGAKIERVGYSRLPKMLQTPDISQTAPSTGSTGQTAAPTCQTVVPDDLTGSTGQPSPCKGEGDGRTVDHPSTMPSINSRAINHPAESDLTTPANATLEPILSSAVKLRSRRKRNM